MSDLKDMMKELRDSIKDSIKEAFAVEFGNSKPALEHPTTSTASLLLATDAPDANPEVPAPACSGLDPGTSATDLSPTAVESPPATEAASDHDNNYIVRTPATRSTKCSSQVGVSVTVGAISATTGCMLTTYLAEWVVHTDIHIIDSSSVMTLPICLTNASVLHPWLQRVPPRPPDPWKIFLGKRGFLLSRRRDLDPQMCPSPNRSLCIVRQSQDYNADSIFSKHLKLLHEWTITGALELHHFCLAEAVVHLCSYRLLPKKPCSCLSCELFFVDEPWQYWKCEPGYSWASTEHSLGTVSLLPWDPGAQNSGIQDKEEYNCCHTVRILQDATGTLLLTAGCYYMLTWFSWRRIVHAWPL